MRYSPGGIWKRMASGATSSSHTRPFAGATEISTEPTMVLDSTPLFDQPGHERDYIELPAAWIPDNVQGGIAEPWNKLDDHFVDMVANDAPSANDVESAWQTSRAAFAVIESAAKKTTVRLD